MVQTSHNIIPKEEERLYNKLKGISCTRGLGGNQARLGTPTLPINCVVLNKSFHFPELPLLIHEMSQL